jgi:hypothetical protein
MHNYNIEEEMDHYNSDDIYRMACRNHSVSKSEMIRAFCSFLHRYVDDHEFDLEKLSEDMICLRERIERLEKR